MPRLSIRFVIVPMKAITRKFIAMVVSMVPYLKQRIFRKDSLF